MDSTFSLPLKNPVLIFSLLLFIILLAPVVLNRLRIPYIVGLIFAGMLVGPHGTNLIARDASIVLFGTVGILYIMFLAGLEIDIADFIRERRLSLAFGSYTFLVPMLLGIVAGKYVLELNWLSAVLLASMFASHTLVAFPLVMRYGVVRDKAVTLTIGGTIFTDTLALLVLAVVVNLARGNAGTAFWLRMALALVLFTGVVLVGVPPLARWVYRRLDDPVTQYIFTMAIVLLCAFLAEVAGVEGIIGAFLSGLALNRLIPHTSPLMHRIEFVGNALFIPIFLIGVGMLVDLRVLLFSRSSQLTAVVMTVVATVAKYLAAFLAQKTFGLSRAQRGLIFGLSNAQAAATLAAVLVGYNFILGYAADGKAIRLLSEDVLNGTVVMILVTCTIASFATERAARQIATHSTAESETQPQSGLLVAFSDEKAVSSLFDLALAMTTRRAVDTLRGIHILTEKDDSGKKLMAARRLIEQAEKYAAAAGLSLPCDLRVDLNAATGLIHAAHEQHIEEILIGWHKKTLFERSTLGYMAEALLENAGNTLYIYRAQQPLATCRRIVVVVPELAERDAGFLHWLFRLRQIAANTGMPVICQVAEMTEQKIRQYLRKGRELRAIEFVRLQDWDPFSRFLAMLKKNDFFICVLARRGSLAAQNSLRKIPELVASDLNNNSTLLVFPRIHGPEAVRQWSQMEENLITPLREFSRVAWRRIFRLRRWIAQ